MLTGSEDDEASLDVLPLVPEDGAHALIVTPTVDAIESNEKIKQKLDDHRCKSSMHFSLVQSMFIRDYLCLETVAIPNYQPVYSQ